MRTVSVVGQDAIVVGDVAVPAADGAELIRLHRAGICGTDIKILSGAIEVEYPRIMGHELIGVVEESASGRNEHGDLVLVNPGLFCGTCDLCRGGKVNVCRRGGLLGRDVDGVFADFVRVDSRFVHPIPDGISSDAAGVLQVLGTVVHAQRTVSVFPGDVAAVIGLGVSGLLHVQMLKSRGVSHVIGVTRSAWKRELALELGADSAVPPEEADVAVAKATAGRGADLVVEAVGSEVTLAQSIELAGHGAHIVVFGTLTGGGDGLPYYELYFKELTLHNPRAATPADYDRAIGLAAQGRVMLEPLVTRRFPLHDAAAAIAAAQQSDNLKVLLLSE